MRVRLSPRRNQQRVRLFLCFVVLTIEPELFRPWEVSVVAKTVGIARDIPMAIASMLSPTLPAVRNQIALHGPQLHFILREPASPERLQSGYVASVVVICV